MSEATLTIVIAVMALYLCLLLFIGWLASRRTHGGEDFHLAGRSLGAWAAGISSTASSESGWVTLGAVGMTYAHGISGLWFAPGCLLGYLVNVYLVAPRLRRISHANGAVTLTDVVTRRWGDPGNVLRVVSTLIILACMMGYVAAQMTAAGKAFSSSFGFGDDSSFGYAFGVVLGAVVITIVTSLGGFRAVAWTDLFQGLLMAFALLAFPLYLVVKLGGFSELFAGLAAADTNLLTATGGRLGSAMWGFIIGNLGIGLGYPGMPHVVTRYMATRDDREIRRLQLIAMLWGVCVFYGAGLMGLAARVMRPDLVDREKALVVMALDTLNPVVAGLIAAAVISAILSTVSSQLLVAASAVSYDVVEKILGRGADDRRSLVLGRLTVVLIGALGVAVALTEARIVFWFVLFAWSGLGASFGPLVLLALGKRGVNHFGALAGMLTGSGVTVAWYLGKSQADNPGAFAAVPVVAAALALLGILVGGVWLRVLKRGHYIAISAALGITLLAWYLVQQWGLDQLYELVPAFFLATAATLGVSGLAPGDGEETGRYKRSSSPSR